MSDRYSKSKKKENKNIKALFSVVCLCIISLGMIVYFSANHQTGGNNAVNENQTLEVTTEVQRAVTVEETTEAATAEETEPTEETENSEPVTMELGEGNTPYKSYYEYPLGEEVVKGYSEELVYDETMGDWRAHAGVDFKGSEGDAVAAVNAGIVINVYPDHLYGSIVEIDHGGKLIARYCGLESVSVKMGSAVEIGDTIGTLGKVPAESAEDSHLHFEMKLEGKTVNPLDVMGKTE